MSIKGNGVTIRVDCDECGETLSLKDNAAGRKLKCRCGAAIHVPHSRDDFDDDDDYGGRSSRDGRGRSRRRGDSSAALQKYGVPVGGTLVALIVLVFAYQFIFGAKSIKPDVQLMSELDYEQSGVGFAIRPPKGWRQATVEKSNSHGPGPIRGPINHADWNGSNGILHIEVLQDPTIRGRTHPKIETWNNGVHVQTGREPILVLPGAKISTVKLGQQLFTRVVFEFSGMSIGPVAHGYPNHLLYISYFDDLRVDAVVSSHAPLDSQEFRILEESLKSLRKMYPGEKLDVPLAPPSPPAFAPVIANGGQQGNTQSGNGSGNASTAGNNSSSTASTNDSRNSKSKSGFKPSNREEDKPSGRGVAGGARNSSKKANWGDGASTQSLLPTEGDKSAVVFSTLNPNLVLVDGQLFDIAKRETVGTFAVSGKSSNQLRAVSPDGKYVATAGSNTIESAEIVTIYSEGGMGFGKNLSTGGRGKQSNSVKFLTFCAANRLAVGVEMRGTPRGTKIFIFNMDTFKLSKEFTCGELDSIAALSPDGKYLCNHTRTGMPVYDLQKGIKVAMMERPSGMGQGVFAFGDCHGLAFSPDSSELAALLGRNRIVVWSAKGKVVFDEILARDVGLIFDRDADGLQWTPDGKAWFLGRQYLLLRDSKLLVWQLKRAWNGERLPAQLVDQQHIVTNFADHATGDLVMQEIPWEQIDHEISATNLDENALVRPGEAMSIEVQVFNVRFGNPQEVANILGTALTKRIEQSKFKVKTGQNVVLSATYNEEQGEQKRVVTGFGFGRDTGQRVYDAKGKLQIKIITKDKKETAWEQVIDSSGAQTIEGEISDASVRNSMFKYMEAGVNQLALPTIIPKPGTSQLPIVTSLER